jgi:hypothetical protein
MYIKTAKYKNWQAELFCPRCFNGKAAMQIHFLKMNFLPPTPCGRVGLIFEAIGAVNNQIFPAIPYFKVL